ncbi:MAG: OmpA family protein [Saprospiraceae bacterium]|nr:OmpA family protein [Saprospiraceae bacterium]
MAKPLKYIALAYFVLLTACTVTLNIKNGTMAYQYKQYSVAIDMLEEEFREERNPEVKAQKARMLAKSHDILQNFGEALRWYDITDQLLPSDASKEDLADILKKNERYEDAKVLYEELYRAQRDNKYLGEVAICNRAIENFENMPNHRIEPINGNSTARDYAPVFFEDDFIVFSSDRDQATGNKIDDWTGQGFSDLFIYNKSNRKVSNFDALLNTEDHEGAACFSQDFNEIFFTRNVAFNQGKPFNRIFYSQRPNGFWMEPEPLMFYGDNVNFGQPTLIENDSVLIFTVNIIGQSNHDLYYSVRLSNGWSEAEIMPSSINTLGNELFPTAYNDTLFFASDGLPGYGGLDIFKTYLRSDGSWARPVNVGLPLNSGADDFGLIVRNDFTPNDQLELEGYFSSSRNTGFSDDIFEFALFKEQKAEQEETEEVIVEEEDPIYELYLAGRVVELVYENDNPNGAVIDRIPLSEADVRIESQDTTITLRTNEGGFFVESVNVGLDFELTARKEEYLTRTEKANTRFELEKDTTVNVEIALSRIIYDTEIVLNNIYYDFNKWNIREDAKPSLDSLSEILRLNPQITIELASHTDCRGEDDFNEELSQKRAQSAVTYLEEKGIDTGRLIAKGYGEKRPAVDCICEECTEAEHQANRRTAFTILRDR